MNKFKKKMRMKYNKKRLMKLRNYPMKFLQKIKIKLIIKGLKIVWIKLELLMFKNKK